MPRASAAGAQTLHLAMLCMRGITSRIGLVAVTLIAIAGVVGVFVAVLAMAEGFKRTLSTGVVEQNVIFMRKGATSELNSIINAEQLRLIAAAPELVRDDSGAWLSPERYIIVTARRRDTRTDVNIALRGVGPQVGKVREEFAIVKGRMFSEGKLEAIVGLSAHSQFDSLDVGDELLVNGNAWKIVGVFSQSGGIAESEVWADTHVVPRSGTYSNVYARLPSADSLQALRSWLAAEPRLASVDVVREAEFYAEQSEMLFRWMRLVGYGITLPMVIGAILGCLNTMSNVMARRRHEIGTLRALGFSSGPILSSAILECLLICLTGALLGCLAVYWWLDGTRVATLNTAGSFSQVVFSFAVSPGLLAQGACLAVLIGTIGAALPAWRAASGRIITR